MFRIFLARDRYDAGVHAVRALLTAWIAEPAPAARRAGSLDRLARDPAGRARRWPPTSPAVWRSAGSAGRRRRPPVPPLLAGVPGELRGAGRHARRAASASGASRPWSTSPSPWTAFSRNAVTGQWSAREPMLEVMARWHYGLQDMQSLRAFDVAGPPVRRVRLQPGDPAEPGVGDHRGRHRGPVRRARRGQSAGRRPARAASGRARVAAFASRTCT